MKKILSIVLVLGMILSLCACAGSGETVKEPSVFRVGYARENITPVDQVPLGGYGNSSQRISQGYLDYLYATCIAISDTQDNTVLLISQDLTNSSQYEDVREAITEATGIPGDNIMLAATHTHSGPEQSSEHVGITNWKPVYIEAMVKAAQAALADRCGAEISVGKKIVDKMNFVRHYLLDNGTYAGSNFGDFSSGEIVDHAEANDPILQVIRFTRPAEDKQDIVMCNWQAHPCFTGGSDKTVLSADFIGSARDYVEKQTGELFIYFTGDAGNQNTVSRIEGEAPARDYIQYGQELGDHVINVLENMTPVASGELKTTKLLYEGKVNHEMEDKIEQAREVQALFKATDRATGNKLAKEYGFSSVYHCNAVIKRSSMDATFTLGLHAISIGDAVSFVAVPYEMFAAHGLYIKENTPFDMTFIMTHANGANGYIPTNKAFDYRCYESDTGRFARGTGDDLAATFVEMLNEHKNG